MNKGLTFLELITVVAIISMLLAIVIPYFVTKTEVNNKHKQTNNYSAY